MLPPLFTNWRGRFILLCSFVGGVVLVWLFAPIAPSSTPFCPLRKANAQDNPCLAQQATITSLQGLLLQATLDHTNNQATLTALMSQLHADPMPTVKPAVGLPFDDKFANNQTGWDTTTHPAGKATISGNKLTFFAHATQGFALLIPGLSLSDHFYAEETVVDNCNCADGSSGAIYGFVVGNVDKNDVVSFTVNILNKDDQRVVINDNHPGTDFKQVDSTHTGFVDATKPVVVGLEANGTLFTIYLDGKEADAVRINPIGQQLGIVYYNGDGGDKSVNFTEVLVRQSR